MKVIKKTDTQYVLLLPETSNSANGSVASDLPKKTGGLVKNVELKHYSYPNGSLNNGYTKVTITTNEPVGVSASTAVQGGGVSKSTFSESSAKATSSKADTVKASGSKPKFRTQQATVVPKENAEDTSVTTKTANATKQSNKNSRISRSSKQQNRRQTKQAVKQKAPISAETAEQPIKLEAKAEETPAQSEDIAVNDEIETEEAALENSPFDSSEYEGAIENSLKSKWKENENLILLIFAILLVPLLILSRKVKTLPARKKEKSIINATIPPKSKKKTPPPTKYQQSLIKIMDNSNLSWQERYNLLKQQEKIIFDNSAIRKAENVSVEEKADSKEEQKEASKNTAVKQMQPSKKSKIQGHLNLSKFAEKEKMNANIQAMPSMIAQVQIASNKGFYLTKFEDQTFLIGYIDENVFVIRKFGAEEISSLQARLNEKRKSGDRYLVKAGSYKALVEVSDTMKLILEM